MQEEPDIRIVVPLAHPPGRVFDAFTDPRLYGAWMGAPDRPSRVEALDVREGGRIEVAVDLPGGMRFRLGGTFTDVQPPHLVAHTFAGDDDDRETLVTFELRPGEDGGTLLVLTESGLGDRPELAEIERSWREGLDRLDRALTS